MYDKFVPDKYFKSIYDIDYKALKKSGVKCLVFNVSNTLVPENIKTPPNKVKDLFEDLREMGFRCIIISNESKKRVTPFKELLCVDSAYHAMKPFKHKIKKAIKMYELKNYEIALIGSGLFFDIYAANRADITSIYVNPISDDKFAVTRFTRKIENLVFNHLEKKDLFKKGRYYE